MVQSQEKKIWKYCEEKNGISRRGNPNGVAITLRHGLFQLGLFALSEAERSFTGMEHFGGYTQENGLKAHFDEFLRKNEKVPGVAFLKGAVAYAEKELKIPAADLLLELCDVVVSNHYSVPDRMLKLCEAICSAYIWPAF